MEALVGPSFLRKGSGAQPPHQSNAINCATMMNDQELLAFLKDNGYFHLRVLEDGAVVGLGKLMFTTALHIGLTELSWERRYCYEDPALAEKAIAALKTGEDFPLEGYVAKRGIGA